MRKQPILFKAPNLTVLQRAELGNGIALPGCTVLETKEHTFQLDAAATEVLVGYLRIIRAYFSCFNRPKPVMHFMFEQVVLQLEQSLLRAGRSIVVSQDVTHLIQHLGSLHDWATWQTTPRQKT